MKNPEQAKNINWDAIIRAIWGTILPHIAGIIKEKSSLISERLLPEKIRNLIASLVGAGAQIFEKELKGVHFEILSDIFEQVSIGVKVPIEEKKKAKPEEVRIKHEWPSLEELEAIKLARESNIKRDLLIKFSSPNLHENIKGLSDKEIEDLLDVLIQLEKTKRELAKLNLNLDFKSIWKIIKTIFNKIASGTKKNLQEAARFIKENYSKFINYLDTRANELADRIERIRNSKKWRLI